MEREVMTKILFADDDAAMRDMVGEVLRAAGYHARLIADASVALDEILRSPPDFVILDYRMGPPDGLTICRRIKSDPRLEHLPVLILTGEGRLEDRIHGFDAGANDYLAKPFDARELLARIRALLRLTRQGLDRNPTSRLPGGEAIEREFQRRRDAGAPFAVCYLDLDFFKPFADRFGFALGDRVIREVGRVLTEVSDADSFVGHIGGDDFILLGSSDTTRGQAEAARAAFVERIAVMIPPAVAVAGVYHGVDREGRPRQFPVTRLAAAIVHVDPARTASLEELGERVAEAKHLAKRLEEIGIVEVGIE